MTSKCNQYIFVISVKVAEAVCKIYASQSAYQSIFGLVVTLISDLLTSKSKQFISVPRCILAVNMGDRRLGQEGALAPPSLEIL